MGSRACFTNEARAGTSTRQLCPLVCGLRKIRFLGMEMEGSQFRGWTKDRLFLLGVQIHVKGFLFVSCLAFALFIMSSAYKGTCTCSQDPAPWIRIRITIPASGSHQSPHGGRRVPADALHFPLSTIGQLFIPDSMASMPIRVLFSLSMLVFVIPLNQTRVRLCMLSVFAMDTPL